MLRFFGWFFLALLAPGVGFWRAGKLHLAVAAWLSLLPLPVALFIFSFAPKKFIWLMIFAVAVWAVANLVQATMGALAARQPVESWRAVIVFSFAAIVLNLFPRALLSGRLLPFRTPVEAMSPTIITGDQFYVLTDRSRYPIERGAVIVHHDSGSGLDYVKRVVALEGDVVAWDGETLSVNGTPLQKGACETDAPAGCHTEQLGQRRWRVLTLGAGPPQMQGRWEVPQGHVFALGDNRHDSLDSRFTDAVPLDAVKGVAEVIHFSWPQLWRTGRPLDLTP